jgi:hypothetical protein
LVVRSVPDSAEAVRLLDRLSMRYVIPEEDGGTVWVIPRRHNPKTIRAILAQLPCVFSGQAFWHRVEVFDEIDASGCCSYDLREHRPEQPVNAHNDRV